MSLSDLVKTKVKVKYIATSPSDPLLKAELNHSHGHNFIKITVNTAHPNCLILDEEHPKFDRTRYEIVFAITKAGNFSVYCTSRNITQNWFNISSPTTSRSTIIERR